MPPVMSEDAKKPADDRDEDLPVRSTPRPATGLFTVYKKGQGKWTRLLTGVGAGAIMALLCQWVYAHSKVWLAPSFMNGVRTPEAAGALANRAALGIAVALFLIGAFFAWRAMNSPRGAEFLITTDAEMKKVNWASRREVFGSMRVVVLFLFFIAGFLLVSDIAFGYFFYLIHVLQTPPF